MAKSTSSKNSSSKNSSSKTGSRSYRFYNMGERGLQYPVNCGTTVVIPAGATGVRIAFGQSHLRRWDEDKQRYMPMNVYCYRGRLYHA